MTAQAPRGFGAPPRQTQYEQPQRGHFTNPCPNLEGTMDLTDQHPPLVPLSELEGLDHEQELDPASAVADVTPPPTDLRAETATADASIRAVARCEAAPTGTAAAVRIEVSALSDVGCVRTNNEDSFGYSEAHGLYVVCDGMGGMASGEIASAIAVVTILETFAASADSGGPASTRLLEAIAAANRAVWQQGQIPEHKGMGTTVVAAALCADKVIIANVGDSRAYIVESGQCMQLTVDHSYLNELIRNGTLTMENAHHADLNGLESVITRAIGAQPDVQPDFFSVDLHPGTTLLLATDGLTRYLLQDEIALVLINSPFEAACPNLIQLAKERGGQDNITCVLIQAVQGRLGTD
jgi:serine/threonine protein phosphatase PrpC